MPPAGDAGPEEIRVARASIVPWQSTQSSSIGGARLGVELSIAVGILLEVAVHAVHAFFEVNVREVHGLFEFIGIFGVDDFIFGIKQIALAVAFVNRAENPAVAVKIGELGLVRVAR